MNPSAAQPGRNFERLYVLYTLTGVAASLQGWFFTRGQMGVDLLIRSALPCIGIGALLILGNRFGVAFPWLIAAALGAVMALPYLGTFLSHAVVAGLIGGLLVLWASRLVGLRTLPRAEWLRLALWGLTLPVVAFLLALIANADVKMADFLAQKMAEHRHVYYDTYMHATIAAMLKNYGTTSLALNGLQELVYHSLSHRFFAGLASLTQLPTLTVYGAMHATTLFPLLLISVPACAESLFPSRSDREFALRLVMVLTCFAGFFGFHYHSVFWRHGLHNAYMFSESYTFSLILLCGFIAAISLPSRRARLVAMLLLLAGMTLAKISVGFIAAFLAFVHVLKFEALGWRVKAGVATVVIIVVGYFVGKRLLDAADVGIPTVTDHLFSFARREANVKAPFGTVHFYLQLLVFFAVFYLYSWIFFLLAGATGWLKPVNHLEFECSLFNAVALLVGGGVLLVFESWHGVVYYFANVAMFVALPFVCVLAAGPLASLPRFGWTAALAAAVMIGGVVGFVRNAPPALKSSPQRLKKEAAMPRAQTALVLYLNHLREIRDDPGTLRYLVYIPKSEKGFWQSQDSGIWRSLMDPCNELPILATALSERPALFGTAPAGCRHDMMYQSYSKAQIQRGVPESIPRAELLQEVKHWGFAGYIEVTSQGWRKIDGTQDGAGS